MTSEERIYLKELVDVALREKHGLGRAKVKPTSLQCRGVTYLGSRCMNTAVESGYCYAHRIEQ